MSADALADTGAILALLDSTDRWHRICDDTFKGLRLPLATSEAVLIKLFHLAGDNRKEMESSWNFILLGRFGGGSYQSFRTPGDPLTHVALLGSADGFR